MWQDENEFDNLRRMRHSQPESFRKQHRQSLFQKHRFEQDNELTSNDSSAQNLKQKANIFNTISISSQLVKCQQETIQDIKIIRQILSKDHQAIQSIINNDYLQQLFNTLRHNRNIDLRRQIILCIFNITNGTTKHCKYLVQFDCIKIMLDILQGQDTDEIKNYAVQVIGNLAGQCIEFKDLIIKNNGILIIINYLSHLKNKYYVTQSCWALSNICRGSSFPFKVLSVAVATLSLIFTTDLICDPNVMVDCLWAISQNCEKPHGMNIVYNSRITQKLIAILLRQKQDQQLLPCIKILGNLSGGKKEWSTQLIRDNNLLNGLERHLSSDRSIIRKQICFFLSNTAVGNNQVISIILSRKILINKMLYMFQNDSPDIKNQLAITFKNFCLSATESVKIEVYNFFLKTQIVKYYIEICKNNNPNYIIEGLKCLRIIFKFGKDKLFQKGAKNIFILMLNNGEVHYLQYLQKHKSEKIYQLAARILEQNFQVTCQI